MNIMKDFSKEIKSEDVLPVLKYLGKVLVKKNNDYGGAGYSIGLLGNLAHITDKHSRIKSGIQKMLENEKLNFESLSDSYLDLAGRAIMGYLMCRRYENENKK